MKTLKDAKNQIDSLKLENENLKAILVKFEERIEALESSSNQRDRGPKSTRDMTEDDARRIMFGDLKDTSHKVAAEKLGLSYGQIYSCRGGYTFKKLSEEKLANKSK